MITKKTATILFLFVSLLVTSQSKVCNTHSDDILDLNTIGKCAIERFKKSNEKEFVQISTRNRYVRTKKSAYVTQLRKNLSVTQKGIKTIDNVDILPKFLNCIAISDKETQKSCFTSEVESYISSNLIYPQEALDKRNEDKVLIGFTINTNGYVKDLKVESSKNVNCLDSEAKRVIYNLPQFEPAKHQGSLVEFRHKVYVNFNLENTIALKEEKVIETENTYIKNFVSFNEVTKKPIFTTCAGYDASTRQECIKEIIKQDILDNLIYPFDAAAEEIEGKVWVRFIVNKEGYITDVTSSGPEKGELLEKEAERIIKLLPKFLPGKHNGEYVNVEYFIPIAFYLNK